MTSVIEQILKHRSIRTYKRDPIPENILQQILEASQRASSSGNMQVYSVIVTRGEELKRKLLEPHFDQKMVVESPVFLTFCADFHRMRQWLKLSQAPLNFDNFMSFMIAAIDAILAAQTAALAAESLGLGICFLGSTLASCEQIAEILECPEHVVPVVGFTMGYPDEQPELRDRLPLKALVHNETYQRPSNDQISELYSEKEVLGMNRYRSAPELRLRIEEAGVENLAQIYTKLKYTRESHLKFSKDVLRCLKNKNFLNHEEEIPV